MAGFFPLVIMEEWSKGMQKIMCACLEPRGGGIYTVDPRFKGDSTASKDKATIKLIFEVPGEVLREAPGGYTPPGGQREDAWELKLTARVG